MEQDGAPPSRPPHTWRKRLVGAALVLVLAWGVLIAMAPGLVRQAAQNWAHGIGRQLEIGAIHIHPLSMSVEVEGIRLGDRDGTSLLRLRRVYLRPAPSGLLLGRWRVKELRIEAPELNVIRDERGFWNWARFIAEASGKAAPRTADTRMPSIVIDSFQLLSGRIHVVDSFENPGHAIDIKSLDLVLADITTLPRAGGFHVLASLAGGGHLDWNGSLQLQPLESSGELELEDLPLASIWPYVHPFLKLATPAGTVSASTRYVFDLKARVPRLSLSPFNLNLDGLGLSDPAARQSLALEQLRIDDGIFDLQKHSVYIKKIVLDGGRLSALRRRDGVINWLAALPAGKDADAARPSAAPSPWKLRIGEIALSNWHAHLIDQRFLTPLAIDFTLPNARAGFQLDPAKGFALSDASAELTGLGLGSEGRKPVLMLERATLAPSQVLQQGFRIQAGDVRLDGLSLNAERRADGVIDWQRLLRQAPAPAPSRAATAGGPAWQLSFPALTLSRGRLHLLDRAAPTPVALVLDDLGAELTEAGGDFDIRAQGRMQSGHFETQMRFDPRAIALQGTLKVDHLPLPPLAPYALGHGPLRLKQGQLSAALDLSWKRGGSWNVGGRAAIDALSLQEPGQPRPLVAWTSLSLAGIKAGSMPLVLSVDDVRLARPVARLMLDSQRRLNLVRLFASDRAPGTAPAAASSTSALPRIDVRRIHVQGGDIDFADLGMTPAFSTSMKNLRGSIDGISSRPGRRGSITLDGDVDEHGDVKVRGALAPFAVADDSDIALRFRDIPLSSLNPYAMNLAGWKITDGSLGVELNYHLQHRALSGDNRVVINSIQLGEEVTTPGVSHLPLRLAVALLEDSDRRIDLQLPVSGNLDDPHFSYGHLVWQALVNVVEKAVTAPFRALSGLLGNGGFDAISFVPGEASVAPPEREKLRQLGLILAKRPRVSLDLSGGYDAERDRQELARARIDLAILSASGRAPLPGEPLATPDWQEASTQAAVKSVFAARRGRLHLLTRTLSPSGPAGGQLARALRDEMIAAEPVDQAALLRLAQQRAEGARQVLLNDNASFSTRVHVLAPKPSRAGADGIPLLMGLTGQ
ncbi:DUF748 domain-containing protein [Paludibacterium yongneupense]|nr:DUF748 domain-containing protein [Paludibacterium yongneupense]